MKILSSLRLFRFLYGVMVYFLMLGYVFSSPVKKWIPVLPPVKGTPAVVEFFSFYCPSCYSFSQTSKIDDAIRNILPKGAVMVKYHVSQLGPMGPELTRVWALAMLINKTREVEQAIFEAKMKKHILNGPEDIRRVFIEATGMSPEEYDDGVNSLAVKEMVMLQERLFDEYRVKSTPSVYVNGKYQINNSSFNNLSIEDLRDSYAITVRELLYGEQ